MSFFRIQGGATLEGTLTPGGNKNEALPVLAAALLTEEDVRVENVPHIADVESMIALLQALGADIEWVDRHAIRIRTKGTLSASAPPEHYGKLRASFLVAPPLLSRLGHAELGLPGGDRIGRRRLDPHLQAFSALGASCDSAGQKLTLSTSRDGLSPGSICLDEPGVMATENALMLAAATSGESVIYPAACEPHVQGLCRMLQAMGAEIDGVASNRLVIRGKRRLGGCTHRISPDHIEVGSFLGLAAATRSLLTVGPVDPAQLDPVLRPLRRLGAKIEIHGHHVRCDGRDAMVVERDFGETIPRLSDGPWPATPADLLSILVVTATQAAGTVLLFEKMFESRLFWVDRLIAMGADAILCDPHRVVISGPSSLRGTRLASPDIRAGMALLIAALVAEGESEIQNITQIDRGYEAIESRLRAVGAQIQRIS